MMTVKLRGILTDNNLMIIMINHRLVPIILTLYFIIMSMVQPFEYHDQKHWYDFIIIRVITSHFLIASTTRDNRMIYQTITSHFLHDLVLREAPG